MNFWHYVEIENVESIDSINSILIVSIICKSESRLLTTKADFRCSVSSIVSASVSAEWNEKTSVNRQQSKDQLIISILTFLKQIKIW
jgi:hypothetical protein